RRARSAAKRGSNDLMMPRRSVAPVPGTPMPKKKKRSKKPALTAKHADKHRLYQESVQDTETEATFLSRTFKKLRGRPASSLREDFCGTALLCAEWVKKKGRTAVGIDLDRSVLDWGTAHNLAPIGEPGRRVELR